MSLLDNRINTLVVHGPFFLLLFRQCSECDQASSDEGDIAMETLPDGTKRSRRQIKGPIKFIPQEMSPEPKKHQVRVTVCIVYTLDTTLNGIFYHPTKNKNVTCFARDLGITGMFSRCACQLLIPDLMP